MRSSSPVISRRPVPIARPLVNKAVKIGGTQMGSAASNRSSSTTTSNSHLFKHDKSAMPPIKSFLNDPKCVELRQLFMGEDDSNLPDYDKYESQLLINLSSHLKEYEHQQASQENYVEASRARFLSDEICHILKMRNAVNVKSINSAGETHLKEEYDKYVLEKINEFKQQTEIKRKNLQTLHSQQMKRLEDSWDNDKPAKYRKPSGKLIQMEVMEKKSAKAGDYDNAETVHDMIESQRQKETNKAQKNLNNDYRNAKVRLAEKQKMEIAQFDEQKAQSLVTLKNKFSEKLLIFANREKVLNERRNQLAEKTSPSPIVCAPVPSATRGEQYDAPTKEMKLSEVKAPNDLNVLKKEEQRLAEERRRKREYQQRNEMKKKEEAEKKKKEIEKYYAKENENQKIDEERRLEEYEQEEQIEQQQKQMEENEQQQQIQNIKQGDSEHELLSGEINEKKDNNSKPILDENKAELTLSVGNKKKEGIIEFIDSNDIDVAEINIDETSVNNTDEKDERKEEILYLHEIIEIPLIKRKVRVFSKEDSEAFKSVGVTIQQIVAGEEFDTQPPLSPILKKYVPFEATVVLNQESLLPEVISEKKGDDKIQPKSIGTTDSNDNEKSYSYVGVTIEAINSKDYVMTNDGDINESTKNMDSLVKKAKRKVRRLVVVDNNDTKKQIENKKNSEEKTEISYKGVTINMINTADLDFEYESDYEYDFN